jgi:FixJ family two-component response regulator
MTEAAATVSAVDDDPSLREALQSLIRSIRARVATLESTQEVLTGNRPNAPGGSVAIVMHRPYLVSFPTASKR